jgi:hypothetical protein
MSVLRLAALAALTSLACFPSAAQAACWYPEEARAAQVRGLQTMLMVGTLQCRHHSRLSEDLYTDFILSQRGVLDANSEVLKARFTRENGAGGERAYDRFGTRLANQYSERLDDPAFCTTVHRLARLAAGASERELLRLADTVAEPPVSGECRPAGYYHVPSVRENGFARYEARRAAVQPPRVAIGDPAEPVGAPQSAMPAVPAPVEVAAAADAATAARKLERVLEASPAPAPAPAPAMVQPAARIEAAAAPAKADRGEALKAAIAALQSAVVALQAVSAPDPAAAEPVGGAEVDAKAADPGTVQQVGVPAASGTR